MTQSVYRNSEDQINFEHVTHVSKFDYVYFVSGESQNMPGSWNAYLAWARKKAAPEWFMASDTERRSYRVADVVSFVRNHDREVKMEERHEQDLKDAPKLQGMEPPKAEDYAYYAFDLTMKDDTLLHWNHTQYTPDGDDSSYAHTVDHYPWGSYI